jgi:excisionase family DNA binding protein
MRTYTPEQAAEVLQISLLTVRRYARQGRLKGSKVGRHWRFTEQDLTEFLEQQRPAVKASRIEYDRQSWDAGYQAGLDGKPATAPIPPEVTDPLAWYSGMIEGHAARKTANRPEAPEAHP